jgi:hypothetical protein
VALISNYVKLLDWRGNMKKKKESKTDKILRIVKEMNRKLSENQKNTNVQLPPVNQYYQMQQGNYCQQCGCWVPIGTFHCHNIF